MADSVRRCRVSRRSGTCSWRPCLVLALLLCVPLPAAADRPLWEIGAGVGTATFPEYRGSNERASFVVPLPYISYSGERLQIGREGARGLLAETPRYELDISFDGAVPVDSSDEGPRAGMDELDPIFEFGPSLDWRLGETALGRWTLRLPLRAAVATDLNDFSHEGWTFQPVIRLRAPDLVGDWDLRLTAGPRFGSREFHAYYYDVGAADVRPGREQYRASAGYSGFGFTMSAARRFGRFWSGAFVRYINLGGAVYEDSPLVETRHALSAGFALSWVFRQSRRRVPEPVASHEPRP